MLTEPAFCDSGSFNTYQGSWEYLPRLLDADVILKLQDTIPSICDNRLWGILANILNSLFLVQTLSLMSCPPGLNFQFPDLTLPVHAGTHEPCPAALLVNTSLLLIQEKAFPHLSCWNVTLVAGLGVMRRGRSWEAQAHLVDCPSQESLVHGLQMLQTESCPLKMRLES